MKCYHSLVTGASGGGKTTLLREYHAEVDACSVFLTTKKNESGVAGKPASGKEALESAVRDADRPEDVRVKILGADYPADTQLVRQWAHAVRETKGWSTQIIVDECQNAPLSDGEGALKDGLHQDRDMGIKWVPATQSPQDLKESRGYPGINQCEFIVWVGRSKTFQDGFISYYSLDGKIPNERYSYHVIRPSRPPEVVYSGTTSKNYA